MQAAVEKDTFLHICEIASQGSGNDQHCVIDFKLPATRYDMGNAPVSHYLT